MLYNCTRKRTCYCAFTVLSDYRLSSAHFISSYTLVVERLFRGQTPRTTATGSTGMRILKRFIDKRTGAGDVKFQCDEGEDMYAAYNFISIGDQLIATTTRNVVRETKTGSVDKSRVKFNITMEVQ
jgi:eRF1 domain 1